MRFHRLQNIENALKYLKRRRIRLVNIRNDDIVDGNPKLTLGLVWTIILHFQIEEIIVAEDSNVSAKQTLMNWAQNHMMGYDIPLNNFTKDWQDGKAFNAIIHRNKPELIDMEDVMRSGARDNLERAFHVAEKNLGVVRLLDPEDMEVAKPDERSIITYVSSLYDCFPNCPEQIPKYITKETWAVIWEKYLEEFTFIEEWMFSKTEITTRINLPGSIHETEEELRKLREWNASELVTATGHIQNAQTLFKQLQQLQIASN